jgi:hypothetical protein
MNLRLFACLLLLSGQVLAEQNLVASFNDPAGDDVGAGNLVYPLNPDYQEGDLDLRSFKLSKESDGYWFEAAFANPIRNPASTYLGAAAESLSDFARKGFYAFNIDIYIDNDRLRDSGNTFSLPGRHVRIDPGYAWEKAVVLTPRPELMRSEMLDALQRQYPDRSTDSLEASINQSIYFPTTVRVRGKTIAFFVPEAFFAGSAANDWAVTVMVTGAKPYTSASGGFLPTNKTPLEELDMGVLQPAAGRPRATFGYYGRGHAVPLVDVLLPSQAQQTALLSGQMPLTGVSWGTHAVNDAHYVERSRDLDKPNAAASDNDSLIARSVGFFRRLMGGGAAEPVRRVESVSPVRNLLDPTSPLAQSSVDAPASAQKTGPGVAARLQTLKKLQEDGLIDEVEFKQHKQRILSDL